MTVPSERTRQHTPYTIAYSLLQPWMVAVNRITLRFNRKYILWYTYFFYFFLCGLFPILSHSWRDQRRRHRIVNAYTFRMICGTPSHHRRRRRPFLFCQWHRFYVNGRTRIRTLHTATRARSMPKSHARTCASNDCCFIIQSSLSRTTVKS